MAKFLVSFRLQDNPTYDDRYKALDNVLDDAGTGFWSAGTSLIAMETTLTIGQLAKKIRTAINTTTDFVLLREIDVKNTGYIGTPGDGFEYFFPDAKKL